MCNSSRSHKLPALEFWNISFHPVFNCIIILFKAIEFLIHVARKVIFRHRNPRNRFGSVILSPDWPCNKRGGSNLCSAAVSSSWEIKVSLYPRCQMTDFVRHRNLGQSFWEMLQLQQSGKEKTSGKQNPAFMRQSINMHVHIESAQRMNKGDKTKSNGLDLKTKANKRMTSDKRAATVRGFQQNQVQTDAKSRNHTVSQALGLSTSAFSQITCLIIIWQFSLQEREPL